MQRFSKIAFVAATTPEARAAYERAVMLNSGNRRDLEALEATLGLIT